MQLPTPEGSPSPRTPKMAVPRNEVSAAYYRKMDISMVLNSSKDEQYIEKPRWEPREKCSLPPTRTQPPASTFSYDNNRGHQCTFVCVNCFGVANGPNDRPQGSCSHLRHYPQNFVGYKQLANTEARNEFYTTRSEPQQALEPPTLQDANLHYERRSLDSWTSTSSTRIQLDDVCLNPKKSPRRASLSPTSGRHAHRSHTYITIPRHSPKLPRRHPGQDIEDAEDGVACGLDPDYESPTRSSCNRPYNIAQVDWIRYAKVDLGLSYESMGDRFALVWPGESKTGHCFSARFYRDNLVPRVDANNMPVHDERGRMLWDPAKMRDMKSTEGKEKCVPYSLVERFPWRAVEYAWVDAERKEAARAIMKGEGPIDPTGGESSFLYPPLASSFGVWRMRSVD
jgi:hypothetical protein